MFRRKDDATLKGPGTLTSEWCHISLNWVTFQIMGLSWQIKSLIILWTSEEQRKWNS